MSKCTCEYCPTIIVPGIGQSKVDLYSSDNKRIKSAWPMDIDTKPLVKKIIPSAILLLLTKSDKAFCKALKKAISEAITQRATIASVAIPILRCVDCESGVKFILFEF